MNDDMLRGRFAAIEMMLGQLFVLAVQDFDDPQAWIADNVEVGRTLLGRRVEEGAMSVEQADSALDSIQKAMQTASRHLETRGIGTAIS